MARKARIRSGAVIVMLAATLGAVVIATPASAASSWISVSAGESLTCGVKADNTLWCWGSNGILVYDGNVPTRVTTPNVGWSSVSVGGHHACALTTTGAAYCWGSNFYGQLGTSDKISWMTPRSIALLRTIVAISAGGSHTCAIATTTQLYCWGDGRDGALGLGTETEWTSPRLISSGWSVVSAGEFATCAINTSGRAYCWGSNYHRQLGMGDVDNQWSPAPISSTGDWLDIDTSAGHTCGVSTAHRLYCWGSNRSGELGIGTASSTPTDVPTRVGSTSNWSTVDLGGKRVNTWYYAFTCGLYTNGTRFCWGYNWNGQVGIGDNTNRNAPRRLLNEPGWSIISAGDSHTCGITLTGTPRCWGKNDYGQLGVGDEAERNVPTTVS